MSKLPGIKAMHTIITPNCRKVRGGNAEAFDEAISRLRKEYMQIIHLREDRGNIHFHLVLTVEKIQ